MCAAICKRGFKRSEDGQTCIGTGIFLFYNMMLALGQGLNRLEKYLNLEGFLEKSLKVKFAFKSP